MKNLLEKISRFFYKLKEDKISECSAECTYFTILAFIPFIIFLISMIQFFNLDESAITFVIKEIFPSSMHELIFNIILEAHSKSVGTISIAAIITLWSAGRGFFALCKGLRNIYKVEEKKPTLFVRLEGSLYTLIFILAIILLLIVRVFGNLINDLISSKFELAGNIISYILRFRTLIIIFSLFIFFLLIYRYIPRHKKTIGTQVVGAVFSAVAWYIASWAFSIYVDVFKGFSNTYGSLTTIILIMMWLYACMYIILVGAELNFLVQEYKFKMLNDNNKSKKTIE